MSQYQKLTKSELKNLYIQLKGIFNTNSMDSKFVSDFVKKYYPKDAVTAIIELNSEYDDEGYDYSVRYLQVLDSNGDELLPLSSTAKQCRAEWVDLPHPDRAYDYDELATEVSYSLSNKLPEVYYAV